MTFVRPCADGRQVGSVCYAIVSEIPSRRLLIKSINLGRALYCLIAIVKGTITPYMLNPTAWNWKGKTAYALHVSKAVFTHADFADSSGPGSTSCAWYEDPFLHKRRLTDLPGLDIF